MPLDHFHDTIAAISTAEGRSALGMVRISGMDAIGIVSKVISEPEALWVARGGSSIYTKIAVGRDIDDVVIHVFRAPRSFTGEDLCEITTHGSPVIMREVLAALIANGAREAEPGEFSRRAFFNGKIGIADAELISIKANAASERELRGAELALEEKFQRLRTAYDEIISLIALVDAEIDFGDSDNVQISDFEHRITKVVQSLKMLLRDSTNLRENAGYFSVALTGPPNVGKSSIFNSLLNFERSIVSEIPGTTRDYVEAFVNVDGFRVKLIDTAGIRETEAILESRGIALGSDAARHSDISLRVTDPLDRSPILFDGEKLLHNKIDLDGWNSDLCISAISGIGIESLHEWLSNELMKRSSDFNRIAMSEGEISKLQSVVESLEGINLNSEPALLSDDLRLFASEIGMLLGMNISEDSLNYIFSKMCIGK